MTEIRGKRTLITGAAKGMGAEMARQFADAGAELILVDIDAEGLQETARQLRRRGHPVHTYEADLSSRENIRQLGDEVGSDVGRIDILINNAGVVQGGPYDEIDDAADETTFSVNIEAVHWMTKTFLDDLEKGRDTHVVHMASAAGFLGVPYQVVYSASKWFVIGLAEGVRLELEAEGCEHVGTTIVCPGLVETGMFQGSEAPRLTPSLEPGYIVERLLDAVRADDVYVQEPLMVKAAPILRALLPTRVNDFILEALGATEIMHGWEGRDSEATPGSAS